MDNKDTFIWTDALVQEFAVKECNSGNDNRFDIRIKHFKESKKEQPAKEWWGKLGIKFDGKWYTHVGTGCYENLDQLMMDLSDKMGYYPQDSKDMVEGNSAGNVAPTNQALNVEDKSVEGECLFNKEILNKRIEELRGNMFDDASIIMSWLSIHANIEKIPTIAYSESIYTYIKSTADCVTSFGIEIFKVNGSWQKNNN